MRIGALVDRWIDWLVAVALAVTFEHELWASPPPGGITGGRAPLAFLILVMTMPLAWRRRAPVTVLFTVVGALAVGSFLINPTASWPLEPYLAVLLAFYSVGAHCDDRTALPAAGAALAVIAGVDVTRSPFQTNGIRPGTWLTFVVALLVGRDLRRRRREVGLLRERAAEAEREREENARAAVGDERGRIARELHDIVAHSVSVMVVQAQAGPRLGGDPDQVARTFRSIEASGREALVELRRLLGILRTGDEQLAIGPQPGLDSLDSLVEQLREAGLAVELRIEGDRVALPPGVDLSAYRIVQEALTNVLKHAGEARAEVVVRYGASALDLEVSDDGRGRDLDGNGSGHGLIGMRERVALYGGELETGTRNGGGYAVRARLPLTGAGR